MEQAQLHITSDSPAAHANPILIGTVTVRDNHAQDEMFSAEPQTFQYGNEATQRGVLLWGVIDKAV